MIIKIEGYQTEILVSGKKCSESKLYWQMKKTISYMVEESTFVSMFSRLFDYEEIDYSDELKTDYIIDIDTYKIFKP